MRRYFLNTYFSLLFPAMLGIAFLPARAEEIGFIETFALAKDRTAVLPQLIPDTEDYFYYHVLFYQSTGKVADAQGMLEAWVNKLGWTERARLMEARQMMLSYSTNREKTIQYLVENLGVNLSHTPPQRDRAASLSTTLDSNLVDYKKVLAQTIESHRQLAGVEDSSLPDVVPYLDNPETLQAWLTRLQRVDIPGLVAQIAKELKSKASSGYGWAPVHSMLTLEQLKELGQLMPELYGHDRFVQVYMQRLKPDGDSTLTDRDTMRDYLQRLEDFVLTLPASQRNLKAAVLHRRLEFDRQQGIYDRERFLKYLQYPRNVWYYSPEHLNKLEGRGLIDVAADYRSMVPELPPIGDDVNLVRDYLEYFFKTDADINSFAEWINRGYLESVFAETKILYGIGDARPHYAKLGPSEQKEIKERVELKFAKTNQPYFDPTNPVQLEVALKNVPELTIKIYRLNSRNILKQFNGVISTDVDLDGLVANVQKSLTYSLPSDRRHVEKIDLPELEGRGIWVVDFLGGGQRSRVLVQKGQLRSIQRYTAAGIVMRVVNESGEHVPAAHAEIGERVYKPDEQGNIFVPYGEQTITANLLLVAANFANYELMLHPAEAYSLEGAFLVEPQSLLSGAKAKVVIRPQLMCNGQPVPLSSLEETSLTIVATDMDGISTTQVVENQTLVNAEEYVHEFLVPQRLSTISFSLKGKVQNHNRDLKQELVTSYSTNVNQLNKTQQLGDFYLQKHQGGYVVHALGRNGEPFGRLPIRFQLKVRGKVDFIPVTLATNEVGECELGTLEDVTEFNVECDFLRNRLFRLTAVVHDWPVRLHQLTTKGLEIPYGGKSLVGRIALTEYRGGQVYEDHSKSLELQDGSIKIKPLRRGDYVLSDYLSGQSIAIAIADGREGEGVLQGRARFLEPHRYGPALVRKATVEAGKLKVSLANIDQWTRVHVIASAFDNRVAAANSLRLSRSVPFSLERSRVPTLFVESLRLDEEYQYVLGRSKQPHYPGVLLAQPSVLLNPWDLSATENDRREASAGDPMAAKAAPAPAAMDFAENKPGSPGAILAENASYEYLAQGAIVATNLIPAEDGTLEVDVSNMEGRTTLQVIVVHPTAVVTTEALLPRVKDETTPDWKLADQRLREAFGADTHRAERQSIRKLKSGEWIDLGDARTTRVRTYSRVSDLYSLYEVLLGDQVGTWEKFRVLTRWPSLSEEEKAKTYDELASHEMHLFLYFKDRPYFDKVVRPYLANKLDKQIVDQWLLGEDVSEYGVAWRFDRLNALERVLVSRAVEAKREAVQRYLVDWVGANPIDPVWRANRFGNGLISNTLGLNPNGDDFGTIAAGMSADSAMLLERQNSAVGLGAPMGVGMGGFGGGMQPGSGGIPGGSEPQSRAEGEIAAAEAGDADGASDKFAKKEGESRRARGSRGGARDFYALGDVTEEKLGRSLGRLYQSVQATKKWAESQYYRRTKENVAFDAVPANAFWLDYLKHKAEAGTFLSENIDLPTTNVHEALLALAVVDLPFEAKAVELAVEQGRLRAKADVESLAFVQAIEMLDEKQADASLLVGQDVYLGASGGPDEKPVARQSMVRGVHYQARVVVTNPTNAQRRVQVLTQIPQGSIAISGGKTSKNWPLVLGPYSSQQIAFDFYFPQAGEFEFYGAQISDEKGFISAAASQKVEVLNEPKDIDKSTWQYVADWGTDDDVLAFLKEANLRKIDLDRIAFRMQGKEFFEKCTKLLGEAGIFDNELWAYALVHRDELRLRELIEHRDDFMQRIGPALPEGLVQMEPVERLRFEHLDFRPLIVARIHQLGSKREILNSELMSQYRHLLSIVSAQRKVSPTQKLEIVYYLLLQNRIAEAIEWFDSISTDGLATRLQYDYFAAYLALYQRKYDQAAAIAASYATYPESRWHGLFGEVATQVKQRQELLAQANTTVKTASDGGPSDAKDESQRILGDNREKQQSEMAKLLPALDLQWKDGELKLNYRNQDQVQINYYLMDIEMLFSRNPFVQQDGSRLSLIEPNHTEAVDLKGRTDVVTIAIPEKLKNANMLVEVIGGGLVRSQTVYANSLEVLPSESLGRLQVFQRNGRQPLDGAYIKVYARHSSGEVRFYKDGYADLRGEFDYASLSTNDLDTAVKFAILVMHPEHGALILELNPPKR